MPCSGISISRHSLGASQDFSRGNLRHWPCANPWEDVNFEMVNHLAGMKRRDGRRACHATLPTDSKPRLPYHAPRVCLRILRGPARSGGWGRLKNTMSSNQVEIWLDEALEPVEFLRASYRDFAFPSHLHPGFAIGIIEHGAQRFSTRRGSSELMPEGTLCAINPGEVHEGRAGAEGGWSYRMFYPSANLVARSLCDDLNTAPAPACRFDAHVFTDAELYDTFLTLHHTSRLAADLLERESRTLVFLRQLFRRHARHRASPQPTHLPRTAGLVKQVLHARFTEAISIGDLARVTGVSETQVIRSFSHETGMAPHAYLLALRVENAKQLIRRGKPLVEVAAETGFSDQSHLHRHFKRLTGMTPGVFAQAMRAR